MTTENAETNAETPESAPAALAQEPKPPRKARVAPQAAHVAADKASSKKGATPKKNAPKGQKTAKSGKPKAAVPKKAARAGKKAAKTARTKEASAPRAGGKGAIILELIGRPKGATLAELMKATDWQKHSIRGYISTAANKHGHRIVSTKREDGQRVYALKG
jgi:hypothetical protein